MSIPTHAHELDRGCLLSSAVWYQVGECVNLSRVHKMAAMSMWTQVYVTKGGKLLGVVNLDSSLNKLRQEEAPVLIAP